MRHGFVLLFIFQTAIIGFGQSQITDDFQDENFVDSPVWVGDTANFIINQFQQLQLSASGAGQSYLATASKINREAVWSFFIKLDFNPSSNNYAEVYLFSDKENLHDPLNGYFVRIGNTQDEVSLYKQSGAKSTAQKIIDGTDKSIDVSAVNLRIKVTKTPADQWELFVDYDLSGNYISEGTVFDGEHLFSGYFGIWCTYSSTRADKFFFDDIQISGNSFVDDTKPTVDSVIVSSDSTIQIVFSEKISTSSAVEVSNYNLAGADENPISAILINDSTVRLGFQNKFSDGMSVELNINGIEDLFLNTSDDQAVSFRYDAPYLVAYHDILITEIMADPTPGVDLPEYEYIEIYNPGNEIYSVNNMKLVVGNDTTEIPDFSILPGEYIILCQSAAVEHFSNYGRILKVSNWPSLNNSGEPVALYNAKEMPVCFITYDDSWYNSVEKDNGGWSLEMIDPDYPCKGEENWTASADPSGGTPGRKNASANVLTDLTAPYISKIIADSQNSVSVILSENIGKQIIDRQKVSIDPDLSIESVYLRDLDFSALKINFEQNILSNTQYILTLNSLRDCSGNIQKETSGQFVLPQSPDSLDLIINEILFNPPSGGIDFVEIYNQSEKYIDLFSIRTANGDDMKTITDNHVIIEPKQFMAICEDIEILRNYYPNKDSENFFEADNLPAFNDDEGEVALISADGLMLDYFKYSDVYHSEFLRETEGVSLERISFEGKSNDPNNWHSASATSGFATPGEKNSQFNGGMVSNAEVLIDPPVFVPGNGAYQNFTIIKCRFEKAGTIADIKILDREGRVIKTFISNQSVGSTENFKWEGTDDTGQQVRMGPYIVFLEIYHTDGSKKVIRKKVVVGTQM